MLQEAGMAGNAVHSQYPTGEPYIGKPLHLGWEKGQVVPDHLYLGKAQCHQGPAFPLQGHRVQLTLPVLLSQCSKPHAKFLRRRALSSCHAAGNVRCLSPLPARALCLSVITGVSSFTARAWRCKCDLAPPPANTY